jgi:hypothetical protein
LVAGDGGENNTAAIASNDEHRVNGKVRTFMADAQYGAVLPVVRRVIPATPPAHVDRRVVRALAAADVAGRVVATSAMPRVTGGVVGALSATHVACGIVAAATVPDVAGRIVGAVLGDDEDGGIFECGWGGAGRCGRCGDCRDECKFDESVHDMLLLGGPVHPGLEGMNPADRYCRGCANGRKRQR